MREPELLKMIAARAARMVYKLTGNEVRPEFIESELRVVHFDICTLRLQDLLDANEDDFAHDIAGIHDHLDIIDASFRNKWWPRFAVKQ